VPVYSRSEYDDGVTIVPMIAPYFTPDTGFGLGAYIVTSNKSGTGGDFDTPDEITFYTFITQRKQFTFGSESDIFFGGGAIKLTFTGEYDKDIVSFWGVGNKTKGRDRENYASRNVLGDVALLHRIVKGFYIGPLIHAMGSTVEPVLNGRIDKSNIPGKEGLYETGAGLSIQFDSRNSIFYPTEGFYIKARSLFQRDELLSELSYSKHSIDASYYFNITGSHVLAFQAVTEFTNGEVPLQALSGIGGDVIMRGLYKNRYIDKESVAAQAEYRFPLFWRITGVLFAATGEVQKSVTNFNLDGMHYTGGGGLRLIFDKEEHITGRFDIGYNEHGQVNAYLLAKEAF